MGDYEDFVSFIRKHLYMTNYTMLSGALFFCASIFLYLSIMASTVVFLVWSFCTDQWQWMALVISVGCTALAYLLTVLAIKLSKNAKKEFSPRMYYHGLALGMILFITFGFIMVCITFYLVEGFWPFF